MGGLSIAFLFLGVLFWQRGIPKKWHKKIFENQLSIPSKITTLLLLGFFFALQFYIHKNVYANGNFKLTIVEEAELADYEKTYKYLERKEHPKYKKVNVTLDYHPKERKVEYVAVIGLSKQPKDTLFLNFKSNVSIHEIMYNKQPAKLVLADTLHHVFGYKVVQNDSIHTLTLKATKQYTGFSQSKLESDITSNGSYGSIKDFLPTIGYYRDKELDENRKRFDNGLEKLDSRMATVDDELALSQLATTQDAERVTGSITISTPKSQTPVAPGILVSNSVKGNRTIATFRIEKPSLFNWHIGSSTYKKFVDNKIANTNYTIYAKPTHRYNIELYEDAIKKSLTYFKSVLPNFYIKELRLYEKHHWSDTDFDAFANTVVISEKHGWVADTQKITEKSYVYQTVASQIATLWVEDNFNIANVQGANMLRIALPEAMALQFIEKEIGDKAIQYLLKKKSDKYSKDRNDEPNSEKPLLYDDGANYLAINKGAVKIYELSKK